MTAVSENIPVVDLKSINDTHREAINSAIQRVIDSGWFILGKEVTRFEENFARFSGNQYCSSVANGTDALEIALRALDIKPGDEVLSVSHTAVATISAIERVGAIPVFVDIEPKTRGMDPVKLEKSISSKTKCIIPVHIYGQPCEIEEICNIAKKHGIPVIEDCAQSHGAMFKDKIVGTFGEIAAYSFYPTKNLGALGDGGAITTNSKELFDKASLLKQYGWRERYISEIVGLNTRLDEIQAAILSEKLPFLKEENSTRLKIAQKFINSIKSDKIKTPYLFKDRTHVMHLFVVEAEDREDFRSYMHSNGVQTALHYPAPVHTQPAYLNRIKAPQGMQETEKLYKHLVSLPMFPTLTSDQIEKVSNVLKGYN